MKWLLLISLFTFSFPASVVAERLANKPMVLFSIQPENSKVGLLTASIYKEAFRRMKIPLEIKYATSERSSYDLDEGRADGQLTRVFEYQASHPNQIRVNTPVMKSSILAVTRKDTDILFSRGWSDLRDTDLRVGYMRGVVASKNRLTAIVRSEKLDESRNIEQGLLKLLNGRIDVFIHISYGLYPYLESEKFDQLTYAGVMETFNIFPYLHIRHKDLVPALEEAINELKLDGTILGLCEQMFGNGSSTLCDVYRY